VWSDVRSAAGRLFQVDGPKTAKRRWPVEVRDHGTCRTTLLMPSAGVDDQEQKQLRRRDPRGRSGLHC